MEPTIQAGGASAAVSHLDAEHRRRLGAWYTPGPLVAQLVADALGPVLARGVRRPLIVDPACGDGNFLAAAASTLEAHGLSTTDAQRCLIGIDIDEVALDRCARRLPGARLVHADGLDTHLVADVVVGNPPFLSQLRTRTARARPSHGYADTAALFLAEWTDRLRPGGRLAMVLPLSILATAHCRPLRDRVAATATVERIDARGDTLFDASVHVCTIVLARDGPDPRRLVGAPTWSALVAEQFGLRVPQARADSARLGDIATATADFRDQYYGLVPAVSDHGDGPPLLTSALIGVGGSRWGQVPARFARQRYEAPRVDLALLSPRMQSWAARRLIPKVLVATQTRTIRAVADHGGCWLPSVPVITVVPNDPADLDTVVTALIHPAATEWAKATYLGAAMQPGWVKLSARQLLEMPLP